MYTYTNISVIRENRPIILDAAGYVSKHLLELLNQFYKMIMSVLF